MSHRALSFALALLATPLAAATASDGKILRCDADSNLNCSGATCEQIADEYAHVDLFLAPSEKDGTLCTFTYCRSFDWLPVLGDRSPRRTFGPILSASSGSTEDEQDIPVVDFHLWISEDRTRFALLPLDAGRAAWAGSCQHQE